MPNVAPIQSNFNGGEISPLLYGRIEVPRYKESLALCENYIPLIQGPVTRRPGTKFVFPTKDSGAARLIRYEAAIDQAYMLEIGSGYIRFYQDNAIVTNLDLADGTITGITNANPAVVTMNGLTTLPANTDRIIITGVQGMTELNNREFTVANASGTTFQLSGVNSTSYGAYTSGGTYGKIYELKTAYDYDKATTVTWPYSASDLSGIKFAQVNNVLYMVHPSYPPFKLLPNGTGASGDREFIFMKVALRDGPYFPTLGRLSDGAIANCTSGTLTGTVLAMSFANTNGVNDGAGLSSSDVGRLIRVKDPTDSLWKWGRISAVSSTTAFSITCVYFGSGSSTLPTASTGFTNHWNLGKYSNGTGWPRAITFHENRLVLGGSSGAPMDFDGSNSGDYENFAPDGADNSKTITASNSYNFTLASLNLNQIIWGTSDEQGLVWGTTDGNWLVTAADSASALSATSIAAKRMTKVGSEDIQALKSGKCSIYIQKGGRKVRELNYYFDVNGFRASDLTQIAEHVTQSKITASDIQDLPQPIFWMIRTDGTVVALTYERDLDSLKVGFSRQIFGGTVSDGSQAVVESVSVVASADGNSEDVYFIVKRYINGSTVRYVEYLTQFFDSSTDIEDAFFVDSGLTYDGTATTTVTGLNHLIGQTVDILADGVVQSSQVVTGAGKITLSTSASKVQVGLNIVAKGQKLRNDAGASDGTAMGKRRRTHRVAFNLYLTLGFEIGMDFNSMDMLPLDDTETLNYSTSPSLFSGITSDNISSNYDFENMICWRQNTPYPGTVLGIYPMQVTQDRT